MSNPPIIKNKFEYPEYESITLEDGSRKYSTPTGLLDSVTTILSATKDKEALINWRKRIGDEEADRQVKHATSVGNLLHKHMEDYVQGFERNNGSNFIHKLARQMADNIINRGLIHVDEIWGIEIPLYYPHAYAGRSDLVGVYKGSPAIMDYKNSKKIKKKEWIDDYFMQGCAYSLAHNELYGTDIRQVVIFMSARDLTFECFRIEGKEFDEYMDKWISRLEMFMTNQ